MTNIVQTINWENISDIWLNYRYGYFDAYACTTPFMSVGDYESAIETYFSVRDKHDSVNCTTPLQDFCGIIQLR